MGRSSDILVVEDDSESLALLTNILVAQRYQVRPANSGRLACMSATASVPDLILLDIRMRGIDGFEVCRRLKASPKTRDVPVIFISAAPQVEERVKGLALGAVDFITKPFQREELLARVRTHLELSHLRNNLKLRVAHQTAELRAVCTQLQQELTRRKFVEKALRESKARFRSLADTAPVGIWVADRDGSISFYNKNALRFAGGTMRQLGGTKWKGFLHPEDRDDIHAAYVLAVADQRAFRSEARIRRADGQYRWMLITGIPRFVGHAYIGHIGTAIEITDLRQNHERMFATQKLESLGVLAAGIAHDFNNVLAAIFAESELALSETPPGWPTRGNLERINAVASRACEIVNLLVAYAGGNEARFEHVNLSTIVEDMRHLLEISVSRNAVLQCNLSPELPVVRADPSQIRQIVLNLITNASEALEGEEGRIRLTTQVISAQHPPAPDLSAGDYVRLAVSDTGRGMTKEVQARVFDPFYTTKFLGRGLGLAAVQGIVRYHHGGVNIVSEPGQGSTFEVLLPCRDRPPKNRRKPRELNSTGQMNPAATANRPAVASEPRPGSIAPSTAP